MPILLYEGDAFIMIHVFSVIVICYFLCYMLMWLYNVYIVIMNYL